MSDKPKERTSGGMLAMLLVVVLLTPVLYVLSLGPVAMLCKGAPVEPPVWFTTLYAPLILLANAWPDAGKFFTWYMKLWG